MNKGPTKKELARWKAESKRMDKRIACKMCLMCRKTTELKIDKDGWAFCPAHFPLEQPHS